MRCSRNSPAARAALVVAYRVFHPTTSRPATPPAARPRRLRRRPAPACAASSASTVHQPSRSPQCLGDPPCSGRRAPSAARAPATPGGGRDVRPQAHHVRLLRPRPLPQRHLRVRVRLARRARDGRPASRLGCHAHGRCDGGRCACEGEWVGAACIGCRSRTAGCSRPPASSAPAPRRATASSASRATTRRRRRRRLCRRSGARGAGDRARRGDRGGVDQHGQRRRRPKARGGARAASRRRGSPSSCRTRPCAPTAGAARAASTARARARRPRAAAARATAAAIRGQRVRVRGQVARRGVRHPPPAHGECALAAAGARVRRRVVRAGLPVAAVPPNCTASGYACSRQARASAPAAGGAACERLTCEHRRLCRARRVRRRWSRRVRVRVRVGGDCDVPRGPRGCALARPTATLGASARATAAPSGAARHDAARTRRETRPRPPLDLQRQAGRRRRAGWFG